MSFERNWNSESPPFFQLILMPPYNMWKADKKWAPEWIDQRVKRREKKIKRKYFSRLKIFLKDLRSFGSFSFVGNLRASFTLFFSSFHNGAYPRDFLRIFNDEVFFLLWKIWNRCEFNRWTIALVSSRIFFHCNLILFQLRKVSTLPFCKLKEPGSNSKRRKSSKSLSTYGRDDNIEKLWLWAENLLWKLRQQQGSE